VAAGQEDVLGLDVAMDDAAAVGVAQGVGHFAGDAERILQRQLPLALEAVAERLPLDEGHGVEEGAGRLSRVEEGEDVGVVEGGGGGDLAEEAFAAEGGGELRVQDLEGDGALVLGVLGEVDGGHAPAPQLALEGVPARQGRAQPLRGVCHQACFRRLRKIGKDRMSREMHVRDA
jgi:hypothetical protein